MPRIWLQFFKRIAVTLALLVAANVIVMAFWSPAWFVYWQVPATCTIFICALGVLLFDTLFQERPR